MNLRHIDPRSTDWMDAMLEGDVQGGRGGTHRHARATTDEVQAESEQAEFLAAPPNSVAETHADRPPPGR